MNCFRTAGLLLMTSLAGRVAADTACPGTESGRGKIDWLYTLPKRESLPPVKVVEKAGAYVLLDERIFAGREDIYSLIAMVGDKQSFEAFGNVEVQTGVDDFADIKARVQSPDGKITELDPHDIHCSAMDIQNIGFSIGKSTVPKHYVFHFPGLVPGAVIHYQINVRTHDRDKQYWLYLYSKIFDIRLGSQYGLGYFPDTFVHARDRYPGNQISYILNLPSGLKYTTRVYPEGAAVEVKEAPSKESMYNRTLRISARRSALPYEPYEPYFGTDTPELAVFVNSTSGNVVSVPDSGIKDWNEWVNRFLSDPLSYTRPSGEALDSVRREAAISNDAPRAHAARLINRFMRDKVANSVGFEIRTAFGHRPPMDVVAKSRTATRFDKALTLASLLKAQGLDARLVYSRPNGRRPIDRSLPMASWFGYSFLVSAEIEGKRTYFDPVSKVASGAVPEHLQGGEAIVVKDRTTWEWATLPVSDETDNLTHAELTVTSREGSKLKGRVVISITGAMAERIRREQELSPASLTRYFTDHLENDAFQGTSYSNVTHDNFGDPDLPLIIRADFESANAARKLGEKTLLRLLPMRLGPSLGTFSAEQRVQDVDFHIPRRFVITIRLPAEIVGAARLPEPAAITGPGLDYEQKFSREGGSLTLQRRLSLNGRIPVAQYGELKKTLARIDAADSGDLLLEK